MPRYRNYDMKYKLRAIELAERNGNRPAARELGIDEKRIREWRSSKENI